MKDRNATTVLRRAFLRMALAAPAPLALAAYSASGLDGGARHLTGRVAHAQELPRTPACADGNDTVSNADGPYYRLYAPEKRSLREDLDGAVLLSLSGSVFDQQCQPVAGALLDFWQANQHGQYDLSGYRLRGHQYTMPDGSYLLETVVPKWYIDGSLWRTSHIHVKVQPPAGPILTTQLFFPDTLQAYGQDTAMLNAQDFLVPPEGIDRVTIALSPLVANHYRGAFNFVLATSYPPLPGTSG
jgi:protocatechuate 3,4-dioxygenase beta subunit